MLIKELLDELYEYSPNVKNIYEEDNVLYDVVEVLSQNGIKDENEILWCGTKCKKASWEKFKKVAKNSFYSFPYDDIDIALIIVGKDWWLERDIIHYTIDEYYWEFKRHPVEPKNVAKFIFTDGEFKVEAE